MTGNINGVNSPNTLRNLNIDSGAAINMNQSQLSVNGAGTYNDVPIVLRGGDLYAQDSSLTTDVFASNGSTVTLENATNTASDTISLTASD